MPGRARVDVVHARAGCLALVSERVRGELRAVVTADELRCTATLYDGFLERRHGRVRIDGTVHDDGE